MSIVKKINKIIKDYNLYALREVILFMAITLFIHYTYRYWAIDFGFAPIRDQVVAAREWLADQVYHQSKWVVANILSININYDDAKRIMYFDNNGFIGVNMSCSGFKQLLQLILLFLIYPGPWKHKAWFIPVGIIAIYLVNLFRIVALSVVVVNSPEYFRVTHDYIIRALFYVVIFALWVVWVEKFYTRRMKPVKNPEKAADTGQAHEGPVEGDQH
jgi:exosortase/archaeosortase family protein